MYVNYSVVAFLLATTLASNAYANVVEKIFVKENNDSTMTSAYWTPERMRHAKPMPIPIVHKNLKAIPQYEIDWANVDAADGAAPEEKIIPNTDPLFKPFIPLTVEEKVQGIDRGSLNFNYSSSRLVPLTADISYPYSSVGKLFFTIPNHGDYVCSAAVIRHRVIATAGHCVHSGTNGSNGFHTNWRFVPAYRDGVAPFGTWDWSYVAVTGTWATGGGSVPNEADYAMIEVRDQVIKGLPRRINFLTGYLGYQTLSLMPNQAHLLGYPCNLDHCEKMHQVTAASARSVQSNNVEYGSDMGSGSSGGPWVQNFGVYATGQKGGTNSPINRIIGITSYGYLNPGPKAQGGSIPDRRFSTVLKIVCDHQPGNCSYSY